MILVDIYNYVFGKSLSQVDRNKKLEEKAVAEEARAELLEKEAEITIRLNAANRRSRSAKQQMGTKQTGTLKLVILLVVIVVVIFFITKGC